MLNYTFRFTFSVRSNERVLRTRAEDSSDGRTVLHTTNLCVVTRSGGLTWVHTFVVDASKPWTTIIINTTLELNRCNS